MSSQIHKYDGGESENQIFLLVVWINSKIIINPNSWRAKYIKVVGGKKTFGR